MEIINPQGIINALKIQQNDGQGFVCFNRHDEVLTVGSMQFASTLSEAKKLGAIFSLDLVSVASLSNYLQVELDKRHEFEPLHSIRVDTDVLVALYKKGRSEEQAEQVQRQLKKIGIPIDFKDFLTRMIEAGEPAIVIQRVSKNSAQRAIETMFIEINENEDYGLNRFEVTFPPQKSSFSFQDEVINGINPSVLHKQMSEVDWNDIALHREFMDYVNGKYPSPMSWDLGVVVQSLNDLALDEKGLNARNDLLLYHWTGTPFSTHRKYTDAMGIAGLKYIFKYEDFVDFSLEKAHRMIAGENVPIAAVSDGNEIPLSVFKVRPQGNGRVTGMVFINSEVVDDLRKRNLLDENDYLKIDISELSEAPRNQMKRKR